MNKSKFTNQKMTWGKVILLAVATAVLTAVLNMIPALRDTSFQDIAINLDCWILFAVFIIVNCDHWWEAALKTFVFFLISQPLIYFIQGLIARAGLYYFQFYRPWFKLTVLTLPGAVIAYQVKRKNWLSVIVLSVATGYLAYMTAHYFWTAMWNFPRHLLSMLFCIALALFFIFTLLDRKGHRLAALAVVLVTLIVSLIVLKPVSAQKVQLSEGAWTYTADPAEIVDVVIEEDNSVTFKAKENGTSVIAFTNEAGEIKEYVVTVSGGGIYINEM